MVIFFKSSNEKFIIYMGKNKFENEDLLKYAFPIDIWFHVDNLSSAHVYLRLAESYTIENIPEEVLEECCQIVKHNSIEGCKKDKVTVCYTNSDNLLKTSDMEVGQVSFKDNSKVKFVYNVPKNKEVVKVMMKTYEEKKVDLEAEKEAYIKEESLRRKKIYEESQKKIKEEQKVNKELKANKAFNFINEIGEETSNKSGKNFEDDFW